MYLYNVIFLTIISISYSSLIMFYLGVFVPFLALFLGLCVALAANFLIKKYIIEDKETHIFQILILIICCLMFRIEYSNYIYGGQDQGVYVNMAAQYSREGRAIFKDKIAILLDEPIKSDYIYNNTVVDNKPRREENKAEGRFLPGIYINSVKNAEYVFQFFHLHPLLMSIAGWLFGLKNMILSLVLLSICSVIGFYLLAYEISANKNIAFFAGVLLAVNPLHVFFSKFPVSENIALFFSINCFYYLVKYWNSYKYLGKENYLYLHFSALSIGAMFFTRISGFLYLPFFIFIGFLCVVYPICKKMRFHIFYFLFSVCFLCIMSIIQGFYYSYPYSRDILKISFGGFLYQNWKYATFFILIVLAMFFISTRYIYIKKMWLKTLVFIEKNIKYIFTMLFIASFYKIYTLAYTSKYVDDPWIGKFWDIANKGIASIGRTSLWISILYISPFLFILFLIVLFKNNTKSIIKSVFLFFLFSFWSYCLLAQWIIPYQYYYARYMLSEVVPYTIMFAVIYSWINEKSINTYKISDLKNNCLILIILFSFIYFSWFSLFQIGKKELDGVSESLDYLSEQIKKNDVVLLVNDKFKLYNEIKTALYFYYNKNIITIKSYDISINILYNLYKNYNEIFLLTQNADNPSLEWTYVGKYQINDSRYEKTGAYIPKNIIKNKYTIYLYKLNEQLPNIKTYFYNHINLNYHELFNFSKVGKIANDRLVSNNKSGYLFFGPYKFLEKGNYKIKIKGEFYNTNGAVLDVVSNLGEKKHAEILLKNLAFDESKNLVGFFNILENIKDIEIRMFISESTNLAIKGYEVTKE